MVCNGDSTTVDFTTDNTGGTTTYTWSNTGGVDINIGPGETVNDSNTDITFTAVNESSEPISTEITVTPTFTNAGVSCVGPEETFTITVVNPTTNVTPFDDQYIFTTETTTAVSITSVTSGTTFTWIAVADTGIEGLTNTSSNGNSNQIPEETLVNDTSGPLEVVYTIIPTSSGDSVCPGNPYTYTVIVNPVVGMLAVDDQVICDDDITQEIVFSSPVSNPVNAITGGSAGTDQQSILGQTLFNETNSPATLTYTVTPTSAEGCVGTPFTVTITVNPTGQVEPVSSQVVCNGDSTTVDFTTDNTGGTTTYTWSNTGGVDINIGPGETVNDSNTDITFTAVNESSEPISTEITVTPTFTNAGVSCVGPGETFTITVTPTAQVVEVEDIVLCNGGDSTEVVFTTENQNGTTLYTWTNNDTSIGLAASGTGNIASFNATNTTTAPVTATVTVTQLRQKVV